MGEAEEKLLEQFYGENSQNTVLTTARLAMKFDTRRDQRESKLRQVHRAIERLNVVPNPIECGEFLASISDPRERQAIDSVISKCRQRRMTVSMVQCREVRLGRWVCVWNNLRGERRWVWWSDDRPDGEGQMRALNSLMDWHRKPSCLLFHKSALHLSEKLQAIPSQRVSKVGENAFTLNDRERD